MVYNLNSVSLDEIDADDHTYHITTAASDNRFERSLAAVGLINPLLIIQNQKTFRIISGFRRVAAARNLGWEEITANILESTLSELACARLAVVENRSQRELNLIEISRALNLLECNLSDTRQLPKVAGELGLPDNPAYIAKLLPLCHYDRPLRKAILNGRVEVAMATRLNQMSAGERGALITLFETLQLNLNQQRESLTLAFEIAKREDLKICDVLKLDIIKNVLADDDLERPQKRRKILDGLKRRRFPAISRAEDEFAHHLRQLKLGNNTVLLPPKNFEASAYTLRLAFQDTAELKKCQQILARIIEHPSLKAILARTTP